MAGWSEDDLAEARLRIEQGKGRPRYTPAAPAPQPTGKATPPPTLKKGVTPTLKKPKPRRSGKAARIRLRTRKRGAELPDRPPWRIVAIDPSLKTAGIVERTRRAGGQGQYDYTRLETLDSFGLTCYLQEQATLSEQEGKGEYVLLLIEDAHQRKSGSYGGKAANQAYRQLQAGKGVNKQQHAAYRTALLGSGYAKAASTLVKQTANHLGLSYAMLRPSNTKASIPASVRADQEMLQRSINASVRTITGLTTQTDYSEHVYDALQIAARFHPGGWKLYLAALLAELE